MDTETTSDTQRQSSAGKLAAAAVVSMLLGLGLMALLLLMHLFGWDSGGQISELVEPLSYLGGGLCLFIVAPFLGIFAVADIVRNRRDYTNPHEGRYNRAQILKAARSFLLSSLLYVLLALSRVTTGIISPTVGTAMLTTGFSIWFISIALLALLTGGISFRLFARASGPGKARIVAGCAIIAGLVAVGAIPWNTNFGVYLLQSYSQMAMTFSGESGLLERTVIVPTLDSPRPANKNVIWCSSFQLAWNQMKDDVIGAPVKVVGAEEIAARLNETGQSANDLEADSFYAAAGRVKEGIIDKIRKDMAAKFPAHSVPDFNEVADYPNGILSYSYLTANVPFRHPFRQVKREFTFTDSNGVETNVGAFGVWGFESCYKRMREQVEIFYAQVDWDANDPDLRMKEFMIDLCRHSEPYQVIAAVVEPRPSLTETVDYVSSKIADVIKYGKSDQQRVLQDEDVLIVPEMCWEIDHRFDELIGRIVPNANPAMPIIGARQVTKFKLDRCGATLESEAHIAAAATPREFIFNRPFLVYMKKRECERPFFVMWVDNAELLNKK